MKRNAVAWAALVVSAAALVGSHNFTKPVPAAQEIPAEGQKAAKSLSDAFGAVADFVKPSVVSISVQKKGVAGMLGGGRRAPFRFFGDPDKMTPKDREKLKDLFKQFNPDLKDDQFDQFFNGPEGKKKESKPRLEKEQFDFRPEGTGSGFVYDDKGHILTNNHVVADTEKIEVTFSDGEVLPAKVVGTDPDADVAVIKVDSNAYRPLPKGQSKNLRVGEWVIAVGSPFGLDQTVTAGIISATEHTLSPEINKYAAMIQTDAAINPGNSGGPLLDMNGRVIGINSAIATGSHTSAGVGFAIPIDLASQLADKLIKDGKISRVMVGIKMQSLTPQVIREHKLDAKTKGVLVDGVAKGSPAEKAGIKPGDVITGFEGQPVNSMAGFRNLVSTSDPGKSYSLKFVRGGHEETASLTPAPEKEILTAFGQRDREERQSTERRETKSDGFGLGVQELTPELAKNFGYPKDTEGVVVAAVEEGSPAEAAGLEEGDLIVKVVKDKKIQPVKTLKDFREAVGKGETDELAMYVKDVNNPTKPGQFITLTKGEKKEKKDQK